MCNISDRFKYFDKIKFYDLKEKDEDFIALMKKPFQKLNPWPGDPPDGL